MSVYTFNFRPDYDAQLSQEPKVNVTKFGDGYELRVPEGINNAPEKWTLQFSCASVTYPQILAFLQARSAVQSFNWTNPFGQTNTYVARSWRIQRYRGYAVLSVDFEQVFEV